MRCDTGEIYADQRAAIRAALGNESVVKEMAIPPTVQQLVRGKVGRNEPCPCNSGKKFKKCCLLRPNP